MVSVSLLDSLNRRRLDGRKGFLQEAIFPDKRSPSYSKDRLFVGWQKPMEWVEWEEHRGEWESAGKWQPFYINISQSITELILGPRGSGKTWLLRGQLSRLAKAKYHCAHVSDIKNEMISNNKPALKKYAYLLHKARHEVPEAIPTVALLPKFLERAYIDYPKGNQKFQLSFRDITEKDLITIFGCEKDRDKIEIMKKLYAEITSLNITTFEEMSDYIMDLRELNAQAKKKLILAIDNLEREQVFGDEYSKDIVEILKKGEVLSLNLKGYDEFAHAYSQSYVSCIVNRLRRARRAKELPRPLYLFADEAHAFCPNKGDPASKKELIDVINVDRLHGVSLILATQYPEQLPRDDVLKQITHFFLPYNIDPDTRKFVLDLAGVRRREDQYTDKWKKFWAKLKKHEWCYINRETKKPAKIKPASPLCRHAEEEKTDF